MSAKALWAKTLDLRTMIDFQCSNFRAYPGKQNKPASWVGLIINQLDSTVLAHTTEILRTFANGLGVFYWEPEAYNWQNYSSGAFDNTGKPIIAMDAFLIQ